MRIFEQVSSILRRKILSRKIGGRNSNGESDRYERFVGTLPERSPLGGEGKTDEMKVNYINVLHLKIEEVIA